MLAVVDANYKFLYVDVGCNGRVSYGGVLPTSTFARKLESGVGMPNAGPGGEMHVPYVFVGDEAFPLRLLLYFEESYS